MRPLIFFLLLLTTAPLFAQKDSCGCFSLRPFPDFISQGTAFAQYKEYEKTEPYTGICHLYYMKEAYVLPDYDRTYQYARFEKGELMYFIQFNETGDTTVFFQRVKRDSVIAIERKFDYQTGSLQSQGIYYYSGKEKKYKLYSYSPEGYISAESNYFFPGKGDSLNYSGSVFINYKKESELGKDGFYNMPVQEGPYVEYGGSGGKVITVRGAYHHNYKTGVWTTRYASGAMKSEGGYVAYNWEHGVWKQWYENGQLLSEIEYCRSNYCGVFREWYANGSVKTQRIYRDYKRNGTGVDYWENGNLQKRDMFENGMLRRSESWYASGQQQALAQFNAQGQPDGEQKTWYESGAVKSEVTYLNGMHSTGEKEYYPSGMLMHATDYTHDMPSAQRWYYPDGKLRADEACNNYARNGRSAYYFPSGLLKQETNYVNGSKEGKEVNYHENGNVASELSYMRNELRGLCRWYHSNGKLWREASYEYSLRHGSFKEYAATGRLQYEQMYDHGKPLTNRRPKPGKSQQELDRLRAGYAADVPVAAAGMMNARGDTSTALQASPAMLSKVLNDLVCIAAFLPPELDSVLLVHFDSAHTQTHVYLDYVPVYGGPGDTASCPPYPELMNKFITQLDFVPVADECYGDDNGGIRRGFTTRQYFNGRVLDSLMKREDPRSGCEYFAPVANDFHHLYNTIFITSRANYSDYSYRLVLPVADGEEETCRVWNFRVYPDGSVDFIGSSVQTAVSYW
jgi:antitoxin component YwqK of YwqJK toxin-antitoxin module